MHTNALRRTSKTLSRLNGSKFVRAAEKIIILLPKHFKNCKSI